MLATSPATTLKQFTNTERVMALYESATGSLQFQYRNEAGDFILASSFWSAEPQMSESQIRDFYEEKSFHINADFQEGLAMRF
jgi:hypothetical protein